jgi:hypothetical protein
VAIVTAAVAAAVALCDRGAYLIHRPALRSKPMTKCGQTQLGRLGGRKRPHSGQGVTTIWLSLSGGGGGGDQEEGWFCCARAPFTHHQTTEARTARITLFYTL